ncbi:MAG: sigma 54-interacting transcriptional regulator, partial [Desulfitobacteriaceae bacterium]|nr:sigma 54-interacting transcriptional regulator [Desulfitobacteriaceae bacterium]
RSGKPFVKIDCSCLPENLMEIEFFGYERGAVPGSSRSKLGKIELAHQGIVLLSEVCELTPFMQAKLVRFIQDGEFEKFGGSQIFQADVRVIATSSRNLRDAVREGMFREDLYFKLSVIEIKVPPLRARSEDIKVLAEHFVDKFNKKFGKTAREISSEAMQLLVEYEWPGNVRELESVLERAMVNMEGEFVHTWHLAPYIGQFGNMGSNRSMEVMPLDKMEQILLNAALTRYGDNLEGKKKAAQALNISLATLYNKLRKYKSSSSS